MDIQTAIRERAKLVEQRDTVERITKQMMRALNTAIEQRENVVLDFLNKTGQQRGTVEGVTFHRINQTRVGVADWEILLDFIKQSDLWHFLNKAVSKNAVLEFQKETGALPPGVNVSTIATVGFKKSD